MSKSIEPKLNIAATQIIIKTEPETKKWGVFIEDHCFGVAKLQCDAILAARKMAKLYETEPEVIIGV